MADYQSIQENDTILQGRGDIFGGLTVDLTTDKQKYSDEQFKDILKASIACYRTCDIRGVWLKIPKDKSSLIPIAVEQGFEFHHCFSSFIMMTSWLPSEPNKLPTFATTSIGVGGFVINDEGQLLVVQERFRHSDHWKLPGGLANYKEDIRTATKREVFEETGIDTEFQSLICVRHIPEFRFECSDLYFVCLLKPLSTTINTDPTEISHAKWMDLEEYITSPIVNNANKFIAQAYKDQQLKIVPTDMFLFNRDFVFYTTEVPRPSNKL